MAIVKKTLKEWDEVEKRLIEDDFGDYWNHFNGFFVHPSMIQYFGKTMDFYEQPKKDIFMLAGIGWMFESWMFVEDDFLSEDEFKL